MILILTALKTDLKRLETELQSLEAQLEDCEDEDQRINLDVATTEM